MTQNTSPSDTARTATATLAAAATIAAGTTAYGSPLRFENTTNISPYFGTTIDLTMAADAQPYAALNGTSVSMYYFSDYYPTFSYTRTDQNAGGVETWSTGFNNNYAGAFNAGQIIGPGLNGGEWDDATRFAFSYNSADRVYIDPYYVYPYGYYGGYYIYKNYQSGERGFLPYDGSQTYVGVRLTINGANHYGWIGVENNFGYISVFAWGYETEAGVGIQAGSIPTPGALAVVALGAAGALGRRKRIA